MRSQLFILSYLKYTKPNSTGYELLIAYPLPLFRLTLTTYCKRLSF